VHSGLARSQSPELGKLPENGLGFGLEACGVLGGVTGFGTVAGRGARSAG
jgi:hypothetical protein